MNFTARITHGPAGQGVQEARLRAAEAMFDGLSPSQATKCTHAPIANEETLQGIGLIHDLLGDDIDGACAMMDDLL